MTKKGKQILSQDKTTRGVNFMETQTDKRMVAENRKRVIPIHKTCKVDMQIYANCAVT
jgi:hypothetical protein